VGHRDGSVSVLSAINPHLDRLVVWCARSRTFTEVGPASSFDEHGRWMVGPAAQGLTPFAAEVVVDADGGAVVEVGGRLPAPGREVPPVQPAGPGCGSRLEETAEGSREVSEGVGHDLDAVYGPRQAPEDVSVLDGRYLRLDARVAAAADGRVVVCSPRPAHGCPDGARQVVSFLHMHPLVEAGRCVGHVDGELLARPTRSGFADAALYPRFTEVGVAASGGYDLALTCEPSAELVAVAEVAGELVAVEHDDGTWVAVLAEPVAPALRRGVGRRDDVVVTARERFPFAQPALIDLGEDTTADPPPPGEPRPQSWFTPAQLAARLAALGPLPVRLDLRADGAVVGGSAEERDR
jgi:hypothetical protein